MAGGFSPDPTAVRGDDLTRDKEIDALEPLIHHFVCRLHLHISYLFL